jgi:DNA-binding IclR family transcriptional regulator
VSRVQSIERAFAVLGALADGPVGVTEVAERTRLPKSTAARLLASLSREGVVEQVPGDTRYQLGGRLATLAPGLVPTRSLTRLARPSLNELASSAGEAAGLAVAEGDNAHYIEQVDVPNPVWVRDWTGSRRPLHAVASGQVLLAFRSPAAIERYLSGDRERFTERTLVDAEALRARLAEVRRDGFVWTREEFDLGVSSVAAPIAASSGDVVAAVHLRGPSYRFPAPGAEDAVAALVLGAAARIAGSLRQA